MEDIVRSVSAKEIIDNLQDDTYDDGGVLHDKAERWLFRVWRELQRDLFRNKRIVILPVSLDTNTVKLPADFIDYVAIGYKDDCGNFIPLDLNLNLAPTIGVDDQRDICPQCHSVNLCREFDVEQDIETVVIGNVSYTKTTTRVLHPDGRFTEEIEQPMPLYEGGEIIAVEMVKEMTTKCAVPVLACGCIEVNKHNLDCLCGCGSLFAFQCCAKYGLQYNFTPGRMGTYSVFKEQGYIQLSPDHCLNSIMLKYRGDGLCFSNEYHFPLEAMEALISGTYYRSVEKKRNVSPAEKERARRAFTTEKKLINRDKMRQNMHELVEILTRPPRITTP